MYCSFVLLAKLRPFVQQLPIVEGAQLHLLFLQYMLTQTL
jgi:hypothetical protein